MSLCITGMGWVTPLGSGVDAVWERLLRGDEAVPSSLAGPFEKKSYNAFRVPDDALVGLPAHPRLRRASAISRFAVAAGLGALASARSTIDAETARRTALVFAVSNGGVTYTKRFYHDIVATGASAASPLLFPETVFNAPASHLAAVLGLTGASYTLVGDGAVGTLAIQMASDLMANDAIDQCLIVGAEEADWVLCDAYSKWRLLRHGPPIEPFRKPARGTILSEGAGALLLGREGKVAIKNIHPGGNFSQQKDAPQWTAKVLSELMSDQPAGLIVSSANGSFIDNAESAAFAQTGCEATVYSPKPALGESVGASGLWQIITGAQALLTDQVPPLLHSPEKTSPKPKSGMAKDVVVLDCGLNQQIAGLRLTAKS
jgi:3-oxoacyl-(acyl-carrier-protein) synthase